MATMLDKKTGKRGKVVASIRNGFSVKFPGEPLQFILKGMVDMTAALPMITVQQVRESTNPAEKISYDTEDESLRGMIYFALDPNRDPIPEVDYADGTVGKNSIYYGVIVKAVLDYLNKDKSNFVDSDGNELSQVQWTAADILSIRPSTGAMTGQVEVAKQGAAANVLPGEVGGMLNVGRRKAAFNLQGSRDEIAKAFAYHENFSPSAGSMTLIGGVVYSYSTPIAYWASNGEAYVNNEKFSKSTSSQVNAVVRALTEDEAAFHLLDHPDFVSAAHSKTPLIEEDPVEAEVMQEAPIAQAPMMPSRTPVASRKRFSRMIPQ